MYTIAVGLLIFVAGFFVGHHNGRLTAGKLAVTEAPLLLRGQALLEGKCPICDYDYMGNCRNLLNRSEVSSNTLKEDSIHANRSN